MRATLTRFAYLNNCTLGWLVAGELTLATVEDAWRRDPDGPGGQRREGDLLESCIPDGLYTLEPHTGTVHQNVWCMVNHQLGVYHWPNQIPLTQKYGRSACLIHAGVSADSVLGCIAVGKSHAMGPAKHVITDGAAALQALRAVLGIGTTHELLIRPAAGTTEL